MSYGFYSLSALKTCASLLLLASGLGYCTEPIRIVVTDSFGPSQANFQAIAHEISVILAEKFRSQPPVAASITCVWRDNIPETLSPPGEFIVFLSATDQHWAQLAFQLGHELGHVYLGPLRSNGFIETLATAVSLEVLDELAERWAITPAVAGTSAWSVNFSQYRAQEEVREIDNVPEIKEAVERHDWALVRLYLRLRSRDMQQLSRLLVGSQEARALQTLAAMSLRSQTVDWSRLVAFAHSGSVQPVRESDGGKVVYSRIRGDAFIRVQPELCRIGLGCPSAFVAAEFNDRPPNGTSLYFQNTWHEMQEVDFKNAIRTQNRLCKAGRCIGSLISW
jgi:hypothetical protein